MEDLKNKVAIITGARRGMGKSHAQKMAQAGAKVVVSDIELEGCQKVVEEIEKQGGQAMAVKCNVTQKEEVQDMVEKTLEQWGKINILVNNAGICQFKSFLDLTQEDWNRTLEVNLKGYFLCAQAVAEQMIEQESGVIVNIASVAMGQQGVGMSNIVHYCASKGGIAAMTEALAVELAPHNIRVNAIAPGMIETPMIDPVRSDPEQMEAMLNRVPMHRVGRPEEVSDLVLFLASEKSSYMTGSIVVIDGGWLAG